MTSNIDEFRMSVDETEEGPFVRPAETVVFRPTEEEFSKDPLAYIASIQPIAEKYGICKIVPPKSWRPPFAANIGNFRFVPRVQRVNELEATTRIKLNFLNSVAKFLELQGSVLRIPVVERKYLDLYKLHRVVALEGGFEKCCSERGRWKRVAMRMGSTAEQAAHTSAIYKQHYEKLLYPYDVFKSGVYDENGTENKDSSRSGRSARYMRRTHSDAEEQQNATLSPSTEKAASSVGDCASPDSNKKFGSRELKQLTRSVKSPSLPTSPTKAEPLEPPAPRKDEAAPQMKSRMPTRKMGGSFSKAEVVPEQTTSVEPKPAVTAPQPPAAPSSEATMPAKQQSPLPPEAIECTSCHRGDGEDKLLLCDTCDYAYHTYCLLPPLPDVPRGDWCCPKCVSKELSKPLDPYGFVQSSKQYTLRSFGEMADAFKSNYFRLPLHEIKSEQVEREFWRLTKSMHEQVQVEYGADVHVLDMGSGFPVGDNKHLFPGEEHYADSPWNLNNLPLLPRSLLRFVTAEISGMKVPWCYVGMCFSCFCWHVEDHYTYSVNYLHWGDPKTWYGVPSYDADKLQKVMMSKAPELFEQSPDLMHQLTTVINPTVLAKNGVQVYRCDQEAGDFIVTFPRAYHAGFNNGYNFAEAVNFCLPDWLPFGRACIEEYRGTRRHCVFSQEELLCKMAVNPGLLDFDLAAKAYNELTMMADDERKLRKAVFEAGITESSRETFELIPDEERQCYACKTTCFLSAITCSCAPSVLSCSRHFNSLPCSCPAEKRSLLYRYTFDELNSYIEDVKRRSEVFNSWMDRTTAALAPASTPNGKVDIVELRKLAKEALEKRFPENNDISRALKKVIGDADKAARVVQQLILQVNRARTRHSNSGAAKVTVDELNNFAEQYGALPYHVPGIQEVKDLATAASRFVTEVDLLMSDPDPSQADLDRLQTFVENYDLQLPGVTKLMTVIERTNWLNEYKKNFGDYLRKTTTKSTEEKELTESNGNGNGNGTVSEGGSDDDEFDESVSLETVEKLIESSRKIVPNAEMSAAIRHLQDLASFGEHLQRECKALLVANPKRPLADAGDLILRGSTISILSIDALQDLKDAVKRAGTWAAKLEKLHSSNGSTFPPYLEALHVVESAKNVPFKLDALDRMESQVAGAGQFLEKAARVFLIRGQANSRLLEILSPRTDIGIVGGVPGAEAASDKKPLIGGSPTARKSRSTGLFAKRVVESLIVTSVPKIDYADETISSTELFSRYTEASKLEVEAIIELRIANVEKLRRKRQTNPSAISGDNEPLAGQLPGQVGSINGDSAVPSELAANSSSSSKREAIQVCICRKGPTANMNVCALCKEWFHLNCVPAPKPPNPGSTSASAPAFLLKFLCQGCCRSKRPRVDNVLALLLSLQRISLRIHEGDALQFLAERVIAWQQRVRKYLSSTSLLATAVTALKQGADSTAFRDAVNSLTLMSDDGDYVLANLERLYVEGELIEVTLDEISTLWAILNVARPPVRPPTPDEATEALMMTLQHSDRVPAHKKSTKSSSTSSSKPAPGKGTLAQLKQASPVKASTNSAGEEASGGLKRPASSGVQMLMQALAKASRKRRAEEASLVRMEANMSKKLGIKATTGTATTSTSAGPGSNKAKSGASSSAKNGSHGSTSKAASVSQRKRVSSTSSGSARSKPSRSNQQQVASSEDGDNSNSAREWSDEDCSADKCLKPAGDDVNWVQCDNCQLWYHTECLGLGNRVFSEDEKFYCYRCPQPGSGAGSQPSGGGQSGNHKRIIEETIIDDGNNFDALDNLPVEQAVALTEQDVTKIDIDQHVASMNPADLQHIFSASTASAAEEDIAMVMREAEQGASNNGNDNQSKTAVEPVGANASADFQREKDVSDILASLASATMPE